MKSITIKRRYLLTLKKYQGFLKDFIEKAPDEEITEIYENEKLTQETLYKGINIYRVNFYNDNIQKELMYFIKKNNLKEFYYNNIRQGGYLGNYCLPYIIEKDALKIKEEFKDNVKLDLKRHILGKNEIKNLQVGDKVTINAPNFIGGVSSSKGTIYSIDDTKVTVRKYRSKSKGWRLRYGEEGSIKRGW